MSDALSGDTGAILSETSTEGRALGASIITQVITTLRTFLVYVLQYVKNIIGYIAENPKMGLHFFSSMLIIFS
jgi:hypothetical protein